MIDGIPLLIGFDQINGFIRVYAGTRYLVLFGGKKYYIIHNRIRYLIGVKSGSTCVSHNYANIKVDSYDFFSEKTMTFQNVIIPIKSVFNKDKNSYYYNTFLEKTSFDLSKK